MLYLLALFCSPLALLFTGRIFQAIFNLLIYVGAIVLSITIVYHSRRHDRLGHRCRPCDNW